MLPSYPREGMLVRFVPPDKAYSDQSFQSACAGQAGVIFQVCNDSYALVWFGKDLLYVNTAYLESDERVVRRRVRKGYRT